MTFGSSGLVTSMMLTHIGANSWARNNTVCHRGIAATPTLTACAGAVQVAVAMIVMLLDDCTTGMGSARAVPPPSANATP